MVVEFSIDKICIGVIGLGYVGLPLAVEFGKSLPVIGFDIYQKRIDELRLGTDTTLEVEKSELKDAKKLVFTSNESDLTNCNFYIITVPTPIDLSNRPDLNSLKLASKLVGSKISPYDIIVYESTVYPGCTEDVCVPILETASGLIFNEEFFCGYSPERINPGDKAHRLKDIVKVTSGSNAEASEFIDDVYNLIINAGTHRASSIKVAEAAKVIENTQRDLNIALVNELSLIFNKLGIDSQEVLDAAGSKWNFLPFKPGLVGGHCISVDPYYLTHKAQELGYNPEVILSGRRVNDSMGEYVANNLMREMCKREINPSSSHILVMGMAFKENCPDIRNTKVIDLVKSLHGFNCKVEIYDPWVSVDEASSEYGVDLVPEPSFGKYDAIIVAVNHACFKEMGVQTVRHFGKSKHILYDIKWTFEKEDSDLRL